MTPCFLGLKNIITKKHFDFGNEAKLNFVKLLVSIEFVEFFLYNT